MHTLTGERIVLTSRKETVTEYLLPCVSLACLSMYAIKQRHVKVAKHDASVHTGGYRQKGQEETGHKQAWFCQLYTKFVCVGRNTSCQSTTNTSDCFLRCTRTTQHVVKPLNVSHPTLLLKEILKRQNHYPLMPLLTVPDHSVRFPRSGASVCKHGRVKPVQHAL